MLQRPGQDEYASFYTGYIQVVPEGDYVSILDEQEKALVAMFSSLQEEQALSGYAPGKWSLKEVLGHITDTERIMSYRLLRIARGDQTDLPGFDQDVFIAHSNFDGVALKDLIQDFQAVRQATRALLPTIADEAWTRFGTANTFRISARAIAFVIAGHAQHHLNVAEQKYL
ncbi:DinB family protein [Paenibacillus roseipurpureus]|uniref:DinB family protein n=1 Tax=Paenibacillus roseopurpureus TaxID=2918901 RepID=A0AA96LPN0_9BACL|nr:DinB family protein [Paenibacillus sp. MBLB1832]WNR42595.1 DinB family protein [Paenibacillus sp. MBLB1832]